MARMLQVRNIPEDLHRELVRRAAARGQTLTHYVQEILEREIARPSQEDVFERIRERQKVDLGAPAADWIREERETRSAS